MVGARLTFEERKSILKWYIKFENVAEVHIYTYIYARDGLITRPEESYRLWHVVVCDQETSNTRRLKPATGLWKIQQQWLVRPGKQTTNYFMILYNTAGWLLSVQFAYSLFNSEILILVLPMSRFDEWSRTFNFKPTFTYSSILTYDQLTNRPTNQPNNETTNHTTNQWNN